MPNCWRCRLAREFAPEVVAAYERLKREAESGGYRLNPDREFTLGLVEALLTNEKRYGYWMCPCRLAFGDKNKDLDLICPCDYRDADLEEYGTCYCSLYVTDDWIEGRKPHGSIPERRPEKYAREGYSQPVNPPPVTDQGHMPTLRYPVWRCKVCGYICARESPPGICPICKAKQDRFERFL